MAKAAIKQRGAPTECCAPTKKRGARPTAPFEATFRALGDAKRLEIVGLLAAQNKELCVCDIEAHFELGQPTVSHHLRILREAGIVTAERRGTWVYYALDRELASTLRAFLALLET